MNRFIIGSLLISSTVLAGGDPGMRKVTKAESDAVAKFNTITKAAVPAKSNGVDVKFDAAGFGSQGMQAAEVGRDVPIHYGSWATYDHHGDDFDKAEQTAQMAELKNPKDKKLASASEKIRNTATTRLELAVGEVSRDLRSCTKAAPVKLAVEGATDAFLYLNPADCPIIGDGGELEGGYQYDDVAIVTFGVAAKRTTEAVSNSTKTTYTWPLDKKKFSSAVPQNAVVYIRGERKEVEALVKSIDWKSIAKVVKP